LAVLAAAFYYYLGWDTTYPDLVVPENQLQNMKVPRGIIHPRSECKTLQAEFLYTAVLLPLRVVQSK
jgi:hypothetical protein